MPSLGRKDSVSPTAEVQSDGRINRSSSKNKLTVLPDPLLLRDSKTMRKETIDFGQGSAKITQSMSVVKDKVTDTISCVQTDEPKMSPTVKEIYQKTLSKDIQEVFMYVDQLREMEAKITHASFHDVAQLAESIIPIQEMDDPECLEIQEFKDIISFEFEAPHNVAKRIKILNNVGVIKTNRFSEMMFQRKFKSLALEVDAVILEVIKSLVGVTALTSLLGIIKGLSTIRMNILQYAHTHLKLPKREIRISVHNGDHIELYIVCFIFKVKYKSIAAFLGFSADEVKVDQMSSHIRLYIRYFRDPVVSTLKMLVNPLMKKSEKQLRQVGFAGIMKELVQKHPDINN